MPSPEYIAVILCGTAGARMFPLSEEPSSSIDDYYNSEDEDSMNQPTDDDQGEDTEGGKKSENDTYKPKHLLPVTGIPILHRLLLNIYHSGFEECIIACSALDKGMTLESIQKINQSIEYKNSSKGHSLICSPIHVSDYSSTSKATLKLHSPTNVTGAKQVSSNVLLPELNITLLDLPSTCEGSFDALNHVAKIELANHPTSNVVVMPSDLILDNCDSISNSDVLGSLVGTHRNGNQESNVAVTMLLSNVGDEDDQGLPLKESAKQKKGGLARDEEDIEYIALSCNNSSSSIKLPRVIMKRTKVDVEENEDNDGNLPKLILPKYRVRDNHTTNIITTLTTDLSDLHVYVFSPWVVQYLIQLRTGMNSLQEELIPLLISRQFRGIKAAFGKKCFMNPENEDRFQTMINSPPFVSKANLYSNDNDDSDEAISTIHVKSNSNINPLSRLKLKEFYCGAHVLPRDHAISPSSTTTHPRRLNLRACSIPSYLYTCREMTMNSISRNNMNHSMNDTTSSSSLKSKKQTYQSSKNKDSQRMNPALSLPDGCEIKSKFNSIILPHSTVGEKLRLQNSTIGSHCTIGSKCKLNNVVIMDNVTIGENCTLQNSVIGTNVILGENCSLNDCQIGHGVEILKGTKLKGESLTKS